MSEKFYENGLHFECKQCSHCCKDEPGFVYLSQEDLTNLLQWFNVEKNDFIENYCRFVPFYDGSEVLALKEMPNYDCIFLVKEGCKVIKCVWEHTGYCSFLFLEIFLCFFEVVLSIVPYVQWQCPDY